MRTLTLPGESRPYTGGTRQASDRFQFITDELERGKHNAEVLRTIIEDFKDYDGKFWKQQSDSTQQRLIEHMQKAASQWRGRFQADAPPVPQTGQPPRIDLTNVKSLLAQYEQQIEQWQAALADPDLTDYFEADRIACQKYQKLNHNVKAALAQTWFPTAL